MKRHHATFSIATLLLLVAAGCNNEDPNQLLTTGSAATTGCPTTSSAGGAGGEGGAGAAGGSGGGVTTSGAGGSTIPVEKTVLDERVLSYTEALRSASFKLVGNAPTLEEMLSIQNEPSELGKKAKYEELIDKRMADVRFKRRLVDFWRNTFRMAGAAAGLNPSKDTAPNFAAQIVFDKRPFTDLFVATENTCPTFDGNDFTSGSCPNGPVGMETVGILTDPGVEAHYYGNLAFLRVRFFQEIFSCHRAPGEFNPDAMSPPPIAGCEGAQTYTNPWDFNTIAGHTNGGQVDFQDCASVVCGNCHGTINHRAPLLANFDEHGKYQPTISVLLPLVGTPPALMTDWLIPGEPTAYKINMPAADIKQLGQAMASDPEVIECAVTRVWNYAMSKGDVVTNQATLSPEVIAAVVQKFKASGYNMNATWREIFLHDDFVRF